MSQLEKIRNSFLKRGYKDKDPISQNQFYDLLCALNGADFDEEVATQIWEQAQSNSHGNRILAQQLCFIIKDAQDILVQKLQQADENIQKIVQKKRRIQIGNGTPQQKSTQLQKLNIQLQEYTNDRQQYEEDLRLVSQPFGIDIKTFKQSSRPTDYSTKHKNNNSVQNKQLQQVFYLILLMCFIQIVVMYKKYDFLNLLVLVTSMSMFVLDYFDKTYLKITAALTGVSIITDFVWLIMYAGSYWSVSSLSQHNSTQSGYLKFIVFLTIVGIVTKAYLVYLIILITFSGIQSNYRINPIQGLTFDVTAFNDNIITRTCQGGAGGYL